MALSALIILALGQQEVGDVSRRVVTQLETPVVVTEPVRLALTPKLDGVIEEEEWDPFASATDHRAYVQWEPGQLHVAGAVPIGHDLVVSIDTNNDGWLRGNDNVEVRASLRGETVAITARRLDNTQKNGPQWVPVPDIVLGTKVSAKAGESATVYEMSLADAGRGVLPFERERKFGLRYDVAPSDGVEAAAFLPRALTEVTLGVWRSAGMPKNLRVGIQEAFPTVIPGETTRLRVTFGGDNTLRLKRFALRSEGFAKNDTLSSTQPFPTFDPKGRAFVDYDTKVANAASIGYRVMRGTVVAEDDLEGLVQASYRIAPLIDFVLRTNRLKTSDQTRTVRLAYGVRSNSANRVLGGVTVGLPQGWRVLSADDRGYIINRKGFIADRHVDVEIPAGATGTYPVVLRSVLGDTTFEQTHYLIIE
jgi:hypothetical protein